MSEAISNESDPAGGSGAGGEEKIDSIEDVTPLRKLAARHGAIVLGLFSFWAAADVWQITTGLAIAGLLALLDGVVVGWVVGTMAHEWGHFAGARLAGGVAPTLPMRSYFPIFNFDAERSDDTAFRAMGLGGNLGHWLLVFLLVAGLPLDTIGQAALVSAAFAFAVSATTTEIPILRRSYAGESATESFQGLTGEILRRNNWIGAAAGLFLFLVL